jgi:MFS family permease
MTSFMIVLNVGMFAGYQFFGWLADRVGTRKSLLLCFLGASLLLPVYVNLPSARAQYWLGPLLGLFFAYTGPFGAYFPKLYPTRMRSLGAGFCFDVGRGLSAFAPFAFGALAASFGLGVSLGWCALGFACALLLMLRMPEV